MTERFGRPEGGSEGREADAFRAALSAHASDPDFDALDPDVLRRSSRPAGRLRRAWPLLAAAAALLVAVPTVALNLPRTGSGSTAAAPEAAGAAQAGTAQAGTAQPAAAPGSASASAGDSLAPAASGYRWVSLLDVVVQVPATWGYAAPLGADWCAAGQSSAKPGAPFVALDPVEIPRLAVVCPGGIPDAMQAEHLEWAYAGEVAAGDVTRNGWVYSTRVVGSAALTYVHRAGVDVGPVLGSARQVSVDPNGCATSRPSGPAPGASGSANVSGGVACQYTAANRTPALVASRVLDAAAASALQRVVDAAPRLEGSPGAACPVTAVLLLRGEATREVWLHVGTCDTPYLDDGGTRRTLTRDTCAGVFVPPLARWTFGAAAAAVCGT